MAEQTKKPDLPEQMERLSRAVEKSNSFGRAFLIGIIRSFGTVFGVIIITAIAFAFIWRVARTVKLEDVIPMKIENVMQLFGIKIPGQELMMQGILEEQGLENILEQYGGELKKR